MAHVLSGTPLHVFQDVPQSLLKKASKSLFNTPLRYCISSRRDYKICKYQGAASNEVFHKNMKPTHSKETPSMIMNLELPAFECVIQKKCHPEYESVRDECNEWTLSLFDPPLQSHGPRNDATYLNGLYPLFISLCYPSTPSRQRLVHLTKVSNWLFILDDMLDKADLETTSKIVYYVQSMLKSSLVKSSLAELSKLIWLPCPEKPLCEDIDSMMGIQRAKVFVDRFKCEVWEEMCSNMTQSLCVRVVAEFINSLNCMYQHGSIRYKTMVKVDEVRETASPTFEDLMKMRRQDAYTNLLLGTFMEYALEIDLQDILTHKLGDVAGLKEKVDGLKHAVECQTAWTNDLLSLRKELFKGDFLSIVSVLVKQRGISLDRMDAKQAQKVQDIVNEVWQMILEHEKIALNLLKEVKEMNGLELHSHKMLIIYCEEICTAMPGNMYWSTVTARYNGLQSIPWNTPTTLGIPLHDTYPTLDILH